MSQCPKTPLETMPMSSPVVAMAPDLPFEESKTMFRILWTGFITQWGPQKGLPARRQHCWRLRVLLDEMEAVSDPYDGDHLEEILEEWQTFLESLPGFCAYWQCGCAYHKHGTM